MLLLLCFLLNQFHRFPHNQLPLKISSTVRGAGLCLHLVHQAVEDDFGGIFKGMTNGSQGRVHVFHMGNVVKANDGNIFRNSQAAGSDSAVDAVRHGIAE